MKLELTESQALVFYDWLTRFDEANAYPVQNHAEEYVFWTLHGQLEKLLSVQFRDDYRDVVEQARADVVANLRAGQGEPPEQ